MLHIRTHYTLRARIHARARSQALAFLAACGGSLVGVGFLCSRAPRYSAAALLPHYNFNSLRPLLVQHFFLSLFTDWSYT